MNGDDGVPHPTRKFRAGQNVYRTGEWAESLYRVESGVFRLVKHTALGRTITLRLVLPGEYFGEDALLEPIQVERPGRRSDVLALTRGVVEVLPKEPQNPESLWRVTQSMGEQLRRLTREGHYSQSSSTRARVCQFLMRAVGTPLAQQTSPRMWSVFCTHELLAQTVWCTREHVSKVMRELRDEGLISCGYSRVLILDLERMSEEL